MTSPMQLLDDPKLPHLAEAINAAAMAPRFVESFQAALAKQEACVESCALERVQYRPGRRCRLLYRLELRDARGDRAMQWLHGKLMRPGQAQREYEKALAGKNLQNGLWPPVTLWPELEMVVWTFPNDPRMPQLARAVDPEQIRAQIDANLPACDLPRTWHCEAVGVAHVKYMPGKRCVLFCEARVSDGRGAYRVLPFYSKSHGDAMSRYHFNVLRNVHAQLGHVINVPRPLLHWDEANTFWQKPAEGRPLINTLEEYDWDELFPRLGRVLAQFHQSRCAGLLKFDAFSHARDSAQEDAQSLGWLLPEQREHFADLLAQLEKAAGRIDFARAPAVPIHGAIRLEQIVAEGQKVALVDFDAAALGDPLYDVAEFIASLQHLAFTRKLAPERLRRAATAFQRGYAEHAVWHVDERRLAWYAVVSWLSKMHDAWKNLDAPVMAQRAAILQSMESWSKGFGD